MQELMYFQVNIVSADALEPAGANTDLTNVSICCFDCGIKRVKSLDLFDNFIAASDENFMFMEKVSQLQPWIVQICIIKSHNW